MVTYAFVVFMPLARAGLAFCFEAREALRVGDVVS
jgi:hypothetical protein